MRSCALGTKLKSQIRQTCRPHRTETNLVGGQATDVVQNEDYDAAPVLAVVFVLDLVVVLERFRTGPN